MERQEEENKEDANYSNFDTIPLAKPAHGG